ncbi:MAG: hypothetical protein JWO91_2063 [Acidobacteriaceae bacterium]|nr:hypothetical protein [Acidobacteriaceae bacterium]
MVMVFQCLAPGSFFQFLSQIYDKFSTLAEKIQP